MIFPRRMRHYRASIVPVRHGQPGVICPSAYWQPCAGQLPEPTNAPASLHVGGHTAPSPSDGGTQMPPEVRRVDPAGVSRVVVSQDDPRGGPRQPTGRVHRDQAAGASRPWDRCAGTARPVSPDHATGVLVRRGRCAATARPVSRRSVSGVRGPRVRCRAPARPVKRRQPLTPQGASGRCRRTGPSGSTSKGMGVEVARDGGRGSPRATDRCEPRGVEGVRVGPDGSERGRSTPVACSASTGRGRRRGWTRGVFLVSAADAMVGRLGSVGCLRGRSRGPAREVEGAGLVGAGRALGTRRVSGLYLVGGRVGPVGGPAVSPSGWRQAVNGRRSEPQRRPKPEASFRRRDSNPNKRDQNPLSCH